MGKNKHSIRNQIINQIGRTILVILVITALVSIAQMQSLIIDANETELTLQSQATAYQLADFFDGYRKMTQQMAVNPEIIELLAKTIPTTPSITEVEGYERVFENLSNIAGTDSENILATWIGDSDASVLTQSDGFTSEKGFKIKERPWYICTTTETTVVTEPYTDASTGQQILSVASPIYSSFQKTIGVAGMDITMTQIMEVMQKQKIGETGYIILISAEGRVIYHPDEKLMLKNLSEIDISNLVVTAAENQTEGFLEFTEGGVKKYGYLSPVGDTGYQVLSSLSKNEYFSELYQAILILAGVFVLGAAAIVLGMKKTAEKITKPIMELNEAAQKLAEGDLDVALEVTSQDEVGALGRSIEATVERLKVYIVYIDEIASVLGEMAAGRMAIHLQQEYAGEFYKVKEALLNISSSMVDVMTGINASAGQVSLGADELARGAQSLAESAAAQAAAVEELLTTATIVVEQVESNRKDAEICAEQTVHVTNLMEDSRRKMKDMTEAMNQIQETSQQVVGIIKAIEEIADQTNLLSLNASIEAARAGEAGKGFAVVAGEIGKLSEESAKAVNMTRELINQSLHEVTKGNQLVESVVTAIRASVDEVAQVNEMIQKTSENAVDQTMSMEQIRMGIEEISRGVQDSSAISQESSATSEELAAQATTLNEMVQRFEL